MNTRELISSIKSGIDLLTPQERRQAVWVFLLILGSALLQAAALAGVVPFVQLLVDPERTQETQWALLIRDVLGIDGSRMLLVVVGLALLVTVGLKNLYSWFQYRWQYEFTARCENRLGSLLFDQVLNAPYAWSLAQNSVVIREIILGHVVQWARGFLRSLLHLANDALFALSVLGVLLWSNPATGAVVAALAVFVSYSLFRITRPVVLEKTEQKRHAIHAASLRCIQGVSGIKDVKMTGSEDYFSTSFRQQFLHYSMSDAEAVQWKQLPRLGIELIGYSTMVLVSLAALTTGETAGGAASLLVLYIMAALRMMPVMSTMVTTLGGLLDAMPLIREMSQLVASTGVTEAESVAARTSIVPGWRQIRMDKVCYRYPGTKSDAIEDISLLLDRGKSYGLVGASGAGKSTFADLLAGLLEPSGGIFATDSFELTQANRLAWRSRVGYVSQNPFILDGSLIENITFGASATEADADRLASAIRSAQLEEVIATLPEGLDTRLGERGVRLSGGQRQRVAIARALYRDVDLLILDEATSALDNLTESEVAQEIKNIAANTDITIVLVAHRLNTVRNCSKILVFAEGRVIAGEGHEALMASCALYREMAAVHYKL